LSRSHALPRTLDHLLASALATRPADRPATAGAFADALDQLSTGSKLRGVKKPRRNVSPRLTVLLAVVVFGASAALTWLLLR
jgi:hypothetical protein